MTTRIFFVRHGEINNPDKICYGRLPGFGLTPQGEKEIVKTARLLSKNLIDVIYSSPLLRTKQTAKIIGDTLHLPINYSNYLLEVKTSMQGKSNSYIHSRFPNLDIFASKKNNITGETIRDVVKRMKKFIDEIKKKYVGKNIVAVSHGDPIMIVKAMMENLPLKINSIRPVKGYIGHGETYTVESNS